VNTPYPIEPLAVVHEGYIYVTEDLLTDEDTWGWVKSELISMYGEEVLYMVRVIKKPEVITMTPEMYEELMKKMQEGGDDGSARGENPLGDL
jgi:hypothetical protein